MDVVCGVVALSSANEATTFNINNYYIVSMNASE